VSEIEERQQAPIMVLISSCGLDYTHPPLAATLVACHSMSELMPPVIAVVGTCLVPPLAMGRPSSPGVADMIWRWCHDVNAVVGSREQVAPPRALRYPLVLVL